MSFRPIKSRKARHQIHAHLKGRNREEWAPFQAWDWNTVRKKGLELLGRKTFVLLLVGLAITIGFGAMYADPNNSLFHHYLSPSKTQDPIKPIWFDSDPNQNLASWNTKGTVIFIAPNKIKLASSTTVNAVAIDTQPIDLSTAVSKTLELWQTWYFESNNLGVEKFSFFLTRNNTAPTQLDVYNPRDDVNVVWSMDNVAAFSGSSGIMDVREYHQLDPTRTINQDSNNGISCGSGSLYMCSTFAFNLGVAGSQSAFVADLNYTGGTAGTSFSQDDYFNTTTGIALASTSKLPILNLQATQLYWGLFEYIRVGGSTNNIIFLTSPSSPVITTCGFCEPPVSGDSMMADIFIAPTVTPRLDTGGFFGPLIRELISIGVFILNGILSFIGFIAPSIISAFSFLETIWVLVLNGIGNILGFGNVGTDLQTLLGNVINFFTQQVPVIFTNTGALFARFFDVNSVYFSWLPTALNIAVTIATLAINGIVFVLTIIDFSFRLVGGVYLIILLSLFLVYTGDDALGGILGFLETTQWLILGPLGWLCKILNFALDIVTYLVGLIPKPFIQMVAHSIPRIPIIETSARFVNPSFDLAAIRNGNMLAVWAWFVDFTFLAWYNGVTPALPGSLGYLLPGMPATTFAALRGFLPMLEICLIVVSALAFIIWPVNKMFSMISLDLDFLDFDMSPGRKISQTGLGAVRVKIGKKRLQGRLAKKLEKRKAEKMRRETREAHRETREVLSAEEERKIVEQTARLKEEHERLKKLEERNK